MLPCHSCIYRLESHKGQSMVDAGKNGQDGFWIQRAPETTPHPCKYGMPSKEESGKRSRVSDYGKCGMNSKPNLKH